MIKVDNLKKSYGHLEVLKSISFEVEKGLKGLTATQVRVVR